MSLSRRHFLTTLAAGSATALTGCGGGDDPPPTRTMWLLNLNPEATIADVIFGNTTVATGLGFPALTAPAIVEYGTYDFSVRNRGVIPSRTSTFPNNVVDGTSSPLRVFYRDATVFPTTTVLGFAPVGVVNYFDAPFGLKVDLLDEASNQSVLWTLQFEDAVPQVLTGSTCQLQLRNATTNQLLYNSNPGQLRDTAILIFPADAASGNIAVAGLTYTSTTARLTLW